MARAILHVDMDAFFASVEELDNPLLAGKPLIVGGNATHRGVVAAANYAARRFGIHSAMPTSTALRKCPHAVLLPPRLPRYSEISRQVHTIFHRYTPLVEPLSLDEAFLDITNSLRLFGSPESIGQRIKHEIRQELGLVASVGIAPNKFVAKIASDINKPDGFKAVTGDKVLSFLSPLPISRLWGVGGKTESILKTMSIHTIGDLRAVHLSAIAQLLGNNGEHLWQLAHGIDERPVVADRDAKSISHETTFAEDISDADVLRYRLLELTEQVAWRLRKSEQTGKTIFIRLRHSDFTTITRSRSLSHHSDITQEIWQLTRRLFAEHWHGEPLRLIGMGVDNLKEAREEPHQQELFGATNRAKQQKIDQVVDHIQNRFGKTSLHRPRLIKK